MIASIIEILKKHLRIDSTIPTLFKEKVGIMYYSASVRHETYNFISLLRLLYLGFGNLSMLFPEVLHGVIKIHLRYLVLMLQFLKQNAFSPFQIDISTL